MGNSRRAAPASPDLKTSASRVYGPQYPGAVPFVEHPLQLPVQAGKGLLLAHGPAELLERLLLGHGERLVSIASDTTSNKVDARVV